MSVWSSWWPAALDGEWAMAFLLTLAHAPDGDAEMLATAAQDFTSGPSPERAGLPGGASASPRHLGAFLQTNPLVRAAADV